MDKNKTRLILLICTLFSFINITYADTMSFVFENDALVGRDRRYTNGIRIGWLGDKIQNTNENNSSYNYGNLMKSAVEAIPFLTLDAQKNHNAGFSIYQMMFTPSDIKTEEPQHDDIPYAGYLTSSFFLFESDKNSYDEYRFLLGVVGPASGAEELQKIIHKILGHNDPKGWEYQLDNQLTVGIAYGHGERSWEESFDSGLDADWVNNVDLQLGNFYTGMCVGTLFRFGNNYPQNFNDYIPGIMGESALLNHQRRNGNFGWSVSIGLFADAIAYLYTIDSAKEYDLDREIFSGSAVTSFNMYIGSVEIAYSMRIRSQLIEQSPNSMKFGAISVLWNF